MIETDSDDELDPRSLFKRGEAYLSFYSFKEFDQTVVFYYRNNKVGTHRIALGYDALRKLSIPFAAA